MNLRGGPTTTHFGDVNGDGLVDAVLPNGLDSDDPDELRVQLNSGNGFGSRLTAPSPAGYRAPPFSGVAASMTGCGWSISTATDATTCWCSMRATPNPRGHRHGGCRSTCGRTTPSSGLRSTSRSVHPTGSSWDNTQVLDFDGDGALDLVNVGTDGRLRVFKRLGGVPDRLIGIGDVSSRGRTEINYTTLADRDGAHPGHLQLPADLPDQRRQRGGGDTASPRISAPAPSPPGTATGTRYKAARADLHGRGWLGFAEHTVTRVATGATTVTEFDNVTRDPDTKTYPFAQLPKKTTYTVKNVNDAHRSRVPEHHHQPVRDPPVRQRHLHGGTAHRHRDRAGTPRSAPATGRRCAPPPPRPATTSSATPTWSRRPPRAAARSPRTSTTATTPPPG